jgi:predicted DNA-binding transcriptional regulator YafY
MRADRLLSLLLLLQVHRRMTADQMAERLEVSERTIHRDMEALAIAGVPVYAERGPRGGWVLPEDFRTKLPGLTEEEIRALFLSRPADLLSDLGLVGASDAGFIKLLAALPAGRRLDAEYARERIHVDGAGWHGAPEPVPFLPLLQESVWDQRRIALTYERSDRTVVDRLVSPLGLVAKRSTWYLVGAVEETVRTFRVSRVQAVSVLDEQFARPADFDLATYWETSSAEFLAQLPRYSVRVRVAPAALARARDGAWLATVEREGARDAEGWIELDLCFDVLEEACRFILGFGPAVEVLTPAELREIVREGAQELVELYARRVTA